jgi:hypothetical protein
MAADNKLFQNLFGLNIFQKRKVLHQERNRKERKDKKRVLKPKPRGRDELVKKQKKDRPVVRNEAVHALKAARKAALKDNG